MGIKTLYLVRHGQYHTEKGAAKHGKLTALGRRQAKRAGKRLASIDLHVMHHSDMVRAAETAQIIASALGTVIPIRSSQLLREGVPTLPCPWLRTSLGPRRGKIAPEWTLRTTGTSSRQEVANARSCSWRTQTSSVIS
jgi:broad specificity phosphatase PhoE